MTVCNATGTPISIDQIEFAKNPLTPQGLVKLGNKRVMEVVGAFYVLSEGGRWAWMRENGWSVSVQSFDRWNHEKLGSYRTENEVFDIEIKRALFNPRSLL